MVRKWVVKSLVGVVCLSAAACNQAGSGGAPGVQPNPDGTPVAVDIGSDLFKAVPPEKIEFGSGPEAAVVIPNAIVRLDKKQLVPAEVDGKIEVIGTPLLAGTSYDPKAANLVYEQRDNGKVAPYRRLREGDRVVADSIVCLLNDLDVQVQLESSQLLKKSSDDVIGAANEATEAMSKQLKTMEGIKGAASQLEILNLVAQHARYKENAIQAMKEKVKATGDEKRAQVLVSKHRSTSKVNGIITKILREPGEYVRAGDPIMEVLSTEDVRVEGTLESQFADKVVPGIKVLVEPTMPVGPDLKFGRIDLRLEVTGVAVTGHKDRPMIVSSSLDGTAAVWDAFAPTGKPRTQVRLPHPSGVRSVAATGAKAAKQMVATGCNDGKLRVWDVSNPDKISDKPMSGFDDMHVAAISSVAFSHDGKSIATAAGREVFLWDVATAKKLYAFPADHKDAVTSISFTPQATLVTAARDKSLRVWKLGTTGATVVRAVDHRKGNVDILGVSSGGGRALFDQDDGRMEIVNLADGQAIGGMQNSGPAARFAGMAMFSPDDAFVLTAGGDGDMKGELQVWSVPQAGGRGSERRRLVTPYRATPTCAAFGPDGNKWFIAIGTQSGGVQVWTATTLAEQSKVRTGRVTSVIRLDPKTVKIRVETDAVPGELVDLLQDKATATIIIRPGEMAAPPAPTPGSAAIVPAPSGIIPAGGIVVVTPTFPVVPAAATIPVGPIVIPMPPLLPLAKM